VHENIVSGQVIGCAIEVHRQLGPGLLESVYEEALCYEIGQAGLEYRRQRQVPIKYKAMELATPLRLDLLIANKVIIEVKAKNEIAPVDKQQLLTYLRLCSIHLGLLINFNVVKLVDGISRVVNSLPEPSFPKTSPPPKTTLCGPPRL